MSKIRRVLFPIDFSFGCRALVPTVRRMLECWPAEVTLLHVMDDGHWFARRHELERQLARMRVIAERGLRAPAVRCRLERGAADERILEYVQANAVDLLVIPAFGSNLSRHSALGSVADRVLAEAPCPVWLDWGSARSSTLAGMHARQVCCALELNPSDEHVLPSAIDIAEDLGANLMMVHAVTPPAGMPWVLPGVREGELLLAQGRLDELRRRFQASAEVSVEFGPSQVVISRALRNAEAGLLVTGNWRDAILAAKSECPVLRMPASQATAACDAEPEPLYATATRRSA